MPKRMQTNRSMLGRKSASFSRRSDDPPPQRGGAPRLFTGHGEARMEMYRGNFEIEDYVVERRRLPIAGIREATGYFLSDGQERPTRLVLIIGEGSPDQLRVALDTSLNRLWIRVFGRA